MYTKIVSAKPTCPVSEDWLRRHARVDNPSDLDLLQLYAGSATDFLEKYLGRLLITRDVSWTFAKDDSGVSANLPGYNYISYPIMWNWTTWSRVIDLPMPVVSFTSVLVNTWDADTFTLTPSTDYQIDINCNPGRVKFKNYDKVVYQSSSVSMNFSAGYGPDSSYVPDTILHAIMILCTEGQEGKGDSEFNPSVLERAYSMVNNERLVSFGGQAL